MQTKIIAMLGLCLAGPASATERRPNIVILLADDLGYADVGFQGCQDIPTPNIDALAKGGVRCTSGYVSGPYCSPTRAGLLTGRYQQRFGHEFNPGPRGEPGGTAIDSIGLPLSETTIADRLKAAGYATGMVGKWHLGVAPKFHPQKRGFDEYFGFLGGAHVYLPSLSNIVFPGLQDAPGTAATPAAAARSGARRQQAAPIYRGTEAVQELEYLTDAFAREAVSFIERHQGQPFFLYVPFNAVHTPMHATDKRLQEFASIADPMRRTYCAMTLALDEAIGKILEELRRTNLEQDTLIFFCSDNGGPTVPHDALYWRLGQQMAIRKGDWKLVKYSNEFAAEESASLLSPLRLYDLSRDIGETNDLASAQADKAKELKGLWDEWNGTLIEPLWQQQSSAPDRPTKQR